MGLTVVGVSHRTAPVEVRERFAHSPSEFPALLEALGADGQTGEVVLLSTCNRTEFYLVSADSDPAPAVWRLLSARLGAEAARYGYVQRDREAAAHLFRVAAGMDSMILGEAQIHGQVRDAWETCRGWSGVVLNRLFQTALLAGARVRTETAIARGAASVSSAAVQLAKKIFGSLNERRAMVLGAGETAELALECLAAEGVRATLVANRTFSRAEVLARRYGGTAIQYDDCWAQLGKVDLVICSTAAPHPVITATRVKPVLRARGDRPLCILDIAVPRDVDPAVRRLANVFLYDMDDLQAIVAASLEARREELPAAERVIAEEADRFWKWLAGLAAVPVLTRFRAEMDHLREQELAHALRRMRDLTPSEREAVAHFSRALMNKFLHEPSVRLRAAATNGRGLGIVDAVRYLFALEEEDAERKRSGAGPVEPAPEER